MSKTFRLEMKILTPWMAGSIALLTALALNGLADQRDGSPAAAPEIAVESVGPGVYQMGAIRIDTRAATVSFPARIQLKDTVLEYALVHQRGKTHESLLVTDVSPKQIHLACLLLGIKPYASMGRRGHLLKTRRDNQLTVELEWSMQGKSERRSLSDCLGLAAKDSGSLTGRLASSSWAYSGSIVHRGQFIAEEEGSIVSLIRDEGALIQNTGIDRDNDDIHRAVPGQLPPRGTAITVRFQFKPRRTGSGTSP